MVQHSRNFINGHWIAGSGPSFTARNPASDQVVWRGKSASIQDSIYAIKSAREAFEKWSDKTLTDRVVVIESFQKALGNNRDEMARLISVEVGKPLWESKLEVEAMLAKISISIDAFKDRSAEKTLTVGNTDYVTRHRPHGVAIVLGPFNFPGHLPNGHIVPALLAGNTIVFKPSEKTPLVAREMMALWHRAKIPKGVLNLVYGGADVAKMLVSHGDVNACYFTGSSQVGLSLHKLFARQPDKLLAIECGGNNPLIVSDTQDEMAATLTIIQSAFLTAGQRCTCARRLILIDSNDNRKLIKRLKSAAEHLRVGAFTDEPEPFMGPVISNEAAVNIMEKYEALENLGGKPILPMSRPDDTLPFLTPGIVDVSALSDLEDEEVFGPLLKVYWVDSIDEAIKEANKTKYGLSAGILSKKKSNYEKALAGIRAGLINWNAPTTGASSRLPFGGVGISGNHRPSAYFAADYCAYPVASAENKTLQMPRFNMPGLELDKWR